nr:hypothetical protein [Tanacetum cinerariifolium]
MMMIKIIMMIKKDEEDNFDPKVQTPSHVETTDDEDDDEEIQDVNVEGDELDEEDEWDELYKDVNINHKGRDIDMIDAQQTNVQTTQAKDEEPFAGSNHGSKRRRAGKEPESTNIQKDKTSKTTGKSIEGSKSLYKSAQAKQPIYTAKDLEEPAH